MKKMVLVLSAVAALAAGASHSAQCVDGIYPHLAMFNGEGECGTGAVVPWAGSLWVITYGPHCPVGSSDKLYQITPDLRQVVRNESVGGTPANRLVHRETNQLLIGPYVIDARGEVRVVPPAKMPGRLTGAARHLTDSNKVYVATMETGLYELDMRTLAVNTIIRENGMNDKTIVDHLKRIGGDLPSGWTNAPRTHVAGYHAKGLSSGFGKVFISNNGENSAEARRNPFVPSGVLAWWNEPGKDWTQIRRCQFTEVTTKDGIFGNGRPDSNPVWALGWDAKSVILAVTTNGTTWAHYRLPKASYSYDGAHGWNTEWPRIRDVGFDDGTLLATMHGTFWKFPKAFSPASPNGIRPLSTYLKVVGDFCRWQGRIVFGCDDQAKSQFLGKRALKKGAPKRDRSQSNLWFVRPEDLTTFGPPSGEGWVWLGEDVAAGSVSDPFLVEGYATNEFSFTDRDGKPMRHELLREGDWVRVKALEDVKGANAHFTFAPARPDVLPQLDAKRPMIEITDDNGRTYCFPNVNGDASVLCCEVVTERDLLYVGGVFYELPAENAGGFEVLRPIALADEPVRSIEAKLGLVYVNGKPMAIDRLWKNGTASQAYWLWRDHGGRAKAAPTWRMAVEKDGMTNWVTAAENRWAIDVKFGTDAGGWKGRIVNREPGAVVLDFEVMSDPLAVEDGKTALYLPFVYGWRIRNWPKTGVKLPGRKVWDAEKDGVFELTKRLKYPGKFGTMQWCTLNDGTKGFYLGSDDAKCVAKDFRVTYDSRTKAVRLGFDLPMFVPTGVAFDVPRLFFDSYEGDWKAAARRYRAWWNTCRTVARIPDRVKDTVGAMMVILKQQNGEFVWPYRDFESMGDAALAHGLHNIEMHGWGIGGHDRLYPEYDPDPSMGGRETLVKGVAALKKRGIHVTLYANGQLQQHGGTRWYDERGWMCPIRLRDGKPLQEFWIKYDAVGGVHFDVACPACELWRRQMLKNCRDAQELGYLGFFYDQIGKQWPWPCFDVRHGHRAGQYVWQDDRETLFKGILDEMRKTDPDFILWSEAFNDTLLTSVSCYQGLDYVRQGDGRADSWKVENRFVPNIGCEMYPELTAYTFPELITCDRVTDPFCTRARANACAVSNLRVDFEVRYPGDRAYAEKGALPSKWEYGRVSSKTAGLAYMQQPGHWQADRDYLKCVSDFRRRYREILLRGTFRADEGVSVSGGEKLVANRWTGTDGTEGILVWNASERPADVTLGFAKKLAACAEPERGEVAADAPIPANSLRLYRYER